MPTLAGHMPPTMGDVWGGAAGGHPRTLHMTPVVHLGLEPREALGDCSALGKVWDLVRVCEGRLPHELECPLGPLSWARELLIGGEGLEVIAAALPSRVYSVSLRSTRNLIPLRKHIKAGLAFDVRGSAGRRQLSPL